MNTDFCPALRRLLLIAAAALLTAVSPDLSAADELPSIFNGKDLTGWKAPEPNPFWKVMDGVLVGENDEAMKGNVLYTDVAFGDFVFEAEARWSGEIDSGFMLRKPELQLQIGISRSLKRDMTCSFYTGGAEKYPEAGQAKELTKFLKPGDWNAFRLMAKGDTFTVWLNGQKVSEYVSPKYAGAAPIGLQIHPGLKMKVEFRNIRAKALAANPQAGINHWPTKPVATTESLPAADAAKQMKLPPGFSAQVVAAEPDVVQPVAYTMDDRGRLWVVENTNYPECPGKPVDKILVFEDFDAAGKARKRTVFYDKLTFATGIAVGHGGVWVGAPPNLLFFPLKDGADKAAGEPEIVLDGWGNQDTHETLNNFIWGPDGWLYGTHGIFTHSNVGRPGAPDAERVKLNAGVWRYHPVKKKFELYAEGASNQWGVDWDDRGQAFFEACVIPHMWQCIQGARYQRQAGQHFNKHTYEDIKTIADFEYEKRAYAGAMIYLGGQWPKEYRDTFFFNDIHMNKLRCEKLTRAGSGMKAERMMDFMTSPDAWYRGLSPQYGPDGSVFINDWYDKVPCHQQRAFTDRSNGRIYKIVYEGVKAVSVDLAKASDAELVQMQLHENDWYVRHARRLLAERGPKPEVQAALKKMLRENPDETRKLRALWALHGVQGLDEATALETLKSPMEYVRAWVIQLTCEDGTPTAAELAQFAKMAADDPSHVVRLYLASAAQRIPVAQRWPILSALASHAEDAKDHNLPLMLWYAAEPVVAADPLKGAELLGSCKIPKVQEFIARRMAAK